MAKPPHSPADGYDDDRDTTARVVLRELTEASDRRKDHRTFDRILEANHGAAAITPSETPAAPSSRAMPTLPRVTLPPALRRGAPARTVALGGVGLGNLVALAVAAMLLTGSLTLLAHVLAGDAPEEAIVLAPRAPLAPMNRAPASLALRTEAPASVSSASSASAASSAPAPVRFRPLRPPAARATSTTAVPTPFVEEY